MDIYMNIKISTQIQSDEHLDENFDEYFIWTFIQNSNKHLIIMNINVNVHILGDYINVFENVCLYLYFIKILLLYSSVH